MFDDITVIICCAGMGTRLGIGTTKALVNVCGKPIILHQMDAFKLVNDIRIVVGFQAERLIEVVNRERKDIMYAFNYDFQSTGQAESLSKALIGLKKYTVIVDGDALYNPEDLLELLSYKGECLGTCPIYSDEPIYANTSNEYVIELNENHGEAEYSCIAKVLSDNLKKSKGQVYEMLNKLLPIHSITVRTRDIDTPDDYNRLIEWYEGGCID